MYNNPYTVFHVYNHNYVTFDKLVKMFNIFNIKLDFIDDDLFKKRIMDLSKDETMKYSLSGIINDFSKENEIKYVSHIKMDNIFTNKYLGRILFRWPKITNKYIGKYIVYLKSIGYIK